MKRPGSYLTSMLLAVGVLAAASGCSKSDETEKPKTEEADRRTASKAPVAAPAPVLSPAALEGQALVAANCVRCHATAAGEVSKHASAPSFATLFVNYPAEYLEEAFAEGVFVGHGDMPAFEFTPPQIDSLVAYLKTLEPAPAATGQPAQSAK